MSHEAPHWALVQIKDGHQWVTYESPGRTGFDNPTVYRYQASALYEESVASRYEARVVVPTWPWDWEAKVWRWLPTDNVLYGPHDDGLGDVEPYDAERRDKGLRCGGRAARGGGAGGIERRL